MKVNLCEIAKEIRRNKFTFGNKWAFESIAPIERIRNTSYGELFKLEVVIRYSTGKYEDNGQIFQVNYYPDADAYSVFFNGSIYLG